MIHVLDNHPNVNLYTFFTGSLLTASLHIVTHVHIQHTCVCLDTHVCIFRCLLIYVYVYAHIRNTIHTRLLHTHTHTIISVVKSTTCMIMRLCITYIHAHTIISVVENTTYMLMRLCITYIQTHTHHSVVKSTMNLFPCRSETYLHPRRVCTHSVFVRVYTCLFCMYVFVMYVCNVFICLSCMCARIYAFICMYACIAVRPICIPAACAHILYLCVYTCVYFVCMCVSCMYACIYAFIL
jgi:hypothetical protein